MSTAVGLLIHINRLGYNVDCLYNFWQTAEVLGLHSIDQSLAKENNTRAVRSTLFGDRVPVHWPFNQQGQNCDQICQQYKIKFLCQNGAHHCYRFPTSQVLLRCFTPACLEVRCPSRPHARQKAVCLEICVGYEWSQSWTIFSALCCSENRINR